MLRALGACALAVLLIAGVAVAFFPFERLAPLVAARVARETGAETRIESLGVRLGWLGPEVAVRGLSLRWPEVGALTLASLRLRVARPRAWLRGVPTAHAALEAEFGAFDGDVSRSLVSGDVSGFDAARLPDGFVEGGAPIAGAVDARIDFARAPDGPRGEGPWSGTLTLAGAEGSLALPGLPVAIPFERLDAAARLDGAGTLHLDSIYLAGPMVSARAHGTIGAGPNGPASGEVAVSAEIERIDPALLPALAQAGAALGATGAGRIAISGSAEQLAIH